MPFLLGFFLCAVSLYFLLTSFGGKGSGEGTVCINRGDTSLEIMAGTGFIICVRVAPGAAGVSVDDLIGSNCFIPEHE
jgi:hypothetical protein